MEPEKPFACTIPDCGMTFTNEDHLHVHTKKHDMVLQLGMEQKAAFVADQTPTPTRFIRNCEEVGLFQDLQNVNPFDEGFKRAMETKHGILSLEGANIATSSDDVLHTPHLMFPLIDTGDCALFSTTNNQRNITISRSSSDESGAVKEYETTTISKLTNEVTTISRVVGKQDILDRVTTTDDVSIVRHEETARNKDGINETSVSYTNNIIKIHSNVEIRKDSNIVNMENPKNIQVPVTMISYSDSVIKDATNVVTKDVLLTDTNKLQVSQGKVPPIMSQKSLDFVVDSLTTDACHNESVVDKEHIHKTLKRNYDNALNKNSDSVLHKPATTANNVKKEINDKELKTDLNHLKNDDYEVIIKLPNGKHVRMKAVEEDVATEKTVQNDTKEKLKKVLTNKVKDKSQTKISTIERLSSMQNAQIVQNILPITAGTLIPVTIVSPSNTILQPSALPKVSILPINAVKIKKPDNYKAVKRKPRKESDDKSKQQMDANKNSGISNSVVTAVQTVSIENQNDSNLTDDDCVIVESNSNMQTLRRPSASKHYLEIRSAASKRYRERLKETMRRQSDENRQLRENNKRLTAEKAELKLIITEHLKRCPIGDDLRDIQERLKKATTGL